MFISFKYTGNGALYVLNRIANTQIPDAFNIINEGVYLGMYALSLLPLMIQPSQSRRHHRLLPRLRERKVHALHHSGGERLRPPPRDLHLRRG